MAQNQITSPLRPAPVRAAAPKPRNAVVKAIVLGLILTRTRRHADKRRPNRAVDNADLAQRVRRSGEW